LALARKPHHAERIDDRDTNPSFQKALDKALGGVALTRPRGIKEMLPAKRGGFNSSGRRRIGVGQIGPGGNRN
jgi:hypothetical protein